LLGKGFCYKQKFYGINCHQCMQMTPAMPFCTQRCLFCWRDTRLFSTEWVGKADEPSEVIDGCIAGQKLLLTGFPGNDKADQRKVKEAFSPKHAAISLDGEPTLYPMLPELIKEFHERGFTTFLVTNGSTPEVLERLAEEKALPTQLYVSTCAFDEASFKKTLAPQLKDGWTRLNKTLELLPSLNTRKVMRLTLVKNLNFAKPEAYAKLVEKAEPDFVEAKSYMNVGYSTTRLSQAHMPTHAEIMAFASELAGEAGFIVSDDAVESRVALLSKDGEAERNRLLKF